MHRAGCHRSAIRWRPARLSHFSSARGDVVGGEQVVDAELALAAVEAEAALPCAMNWLRVRLRARRARRHGVRRRAPQRRQQRRACALSAAVETQINFKKLTSTVSNIYMATPLIVCPNCASSAKPTHHQLGFEIVVMQIRRSLGESGRCALATPTAPTLCIAS